MKGGACILWKGRKNEPKKFSNSSLIMVPLNPISLGEETGHKDLLQGGGGDEGICILQSFVWMLVFSWKCTLFLPRNKAHFHTKSTVKECSSSGSLTLLVFLSSEVETRKWVSKHHLLFVLPSHIWYISMEMEIKKESPPWDLGECRDVMFALGDEYRSYQRIRSK